MKDELQKKAAELSGDIASGARSVARGTVRVVKWTVIIALLVTILAGWFLYAANYSEGTRSGRLIKISKKGVVFKTYEGQLDVGGISSSGPTGGLTSLWEFSVPAGDQELLDQLEQLSGRKIKIHYEEKYYQFFWRGDTKYFATRAEPDDGP